MTVPQPAPNLMSFRRRLVNIIGLSMGWCLMVSVMFIQLSTTTLAARDYSGASVATLPAGIMMAAATLAAAPGSLLMKHLGRKPVLLASAAAGISGGVLMVLAAHFRLLWLLIVGSIPLGVCFAQANNLRFAATEFAPAGFEPKALSLVVTGAVLSAVVGPEVARHTLHALQPTYVATYVFMTGLCVLYALLVGLLQLGALPGLLAAKQEAAAKQDEAGKQKAAGRSADAGAAAACSALAAAAQGVVGHQRVEAAAKGGASGRPPAATTTTIVQQQEEEEDAQAARAAAAVPGGYPPQQQHSSAPSRQSTTRTAAAPGPASIGRRHTDDVSPSSGAEGSGSDSTVVVVLSTTGCESAVVAARRPVATGGGSAAVGPPLDALGTSEEGVEGSARSSSGSSGSMCKPLDSHRQPLRELFMSWEYVVPVLTASLAYCGMAGMMTASPLAIRDSEYSFSETTQVIQVHIISMFLPSLFTGHVISLIGASWTMSLGSLVLLAGTAVFFAGRRLAMFFVGNCIVGLGWNWAYVGSSALMTLTYAGAPDAKFIAQGVMDSAVMAGTGLAVVSAGSLYSRLGWSLYGAVFVGVSGLMVCMDGGLMLRQGRGRGRRGKRAPC